jgi:hypothetical protein
MIFVDYIATRPGYMTGYANAEKAFDTFANIARLEGKAVNAVFLYGEVKRDAMHKVFEKLSLSDIWSRSIAQRADRVVIRHPCGETLVLKDRER